MIDTADLLEILNHAQPSPLWGEIVNSLEIVATQAELHGYRSDVTEVAVNTAYRHISEAAGAVEDQRYCCICERTTNDHVICDRCRRDALSL